MSCPHGHNSTPTTCSQCLGVRPRRITIVHGEVRVNGRRDHLRHHAIPAAWMPAPLARRQLGGRRARIHAQDASS